MDAIMGKKRGWIVNTRHDWMSMCKSGARKVMNWRKKYTCMMMMHFEIQWKILPKIHLLYFPILHFDQYLNTWVFIKVFAWLPVQLCLITHQYRRYHIVIYCIHICKHSRHFLWQRQRRIFYFLSTYLRKWKHTVFKNPSKMSHLNTLGFSDLERPQRP